MDILIGSSPGYFSDSDIRKTKESRNSAIPMAEMQRAVLTIVDHVVGEDGDFNIEEPLLKQKKGQTSLGIKNSQKESLSHFNFLIGSLRTHSYSKLV